MRVTMFEKAIIKVKTMTNAFFKYLVGLDFDFMFSIIDGLDGLRAPPLQLLKGSMRRSAKISLADFFF